MSGPATALPPLHVGAGTATVTGALRTDAYSFWYGPKQTLFDVSLEVVPNAVTALIGPSGCGKST